MSRLVSEKSNWVLEVDKLGLKKLSSYILLHEHFDE